MRVKSGKRTLVKLGPLWRDRAMAFWMKERGAGVVSVRCELPSRVLETQRYI